MESITITLPRYRPGLGPLKSLVLDLNYPAFKKSQSPVCSRRGGEEEEEEEEDEAEGGGGGGEAGWLTDSKYQMLFQRRRRTGSNKQERVMGSRFPDG